MEIREERDTIPKEVKNEKCETEKKIGLTNDL